MGCLKCQNPYLKVMGKGLHCPKCGHIQGSKMVDDDTLIAKSEEELWQLVDKLHKDGVRYEVIHSIFREMTQTLEAQGYAENWLKQYNK